ncbi:hypothetical protein ColLi_10513 [Colletotrichum liriopes]|uniref:Uncharacterized protein n=1 Tax=Colletotrichum liriopes TaxID=708192 RepID=A0AA37GVW4_9PEZI|nr:hypothetical protein ColLi_10513 [Colletotrichum liriopes]
MPICVVLYKVWVGGWECWSGLVAGWLASSVVYSCCSLLFGWARPVAAVALSGDRKKEGEGKMGTVRAADEVVEAFPTGGDGRHETRGGERW